MRELRGLSTLEYVSLYMMTAIKNCEVSIIWCHRYSMAVMPVFYMVHVLLPSWCRSLNPANGYPDPQTMKVRMSLLLSGIAAIVSICARSLPTLIRHLW